MPRAGVFGLVSGRLSSDAGFEPGVPKALFVLQKLGNGNLRNVNSFDWAVSPDGHRFLMGKDGDQANQQLRVIVNWLVAIEEVMGTVYTFAQREGIIPLGPE